ncbi:MAG: GNAT family N-acetyltransferase [Acidobacteriota bacterium]
MQNIDFRELKRADEPFLWEMLYHALHVPPGCEPFPRSIVESDELRRYVESWGRQGDEGFLAVDKSTPVGAVWTRVFAGENAGYGFVDMATPELSIAVLPEYRGLGIGTELLRLILGSIANRHRRISLSVSATNPAVSLYQRFGFVVTNSGDNSLTMIKELVR